MPLARQPESSTIRLMPFHQGNTMSNKPHLRPHQKRQQASPITRVLVVILIVAIFALVIALEATGHVIFRGRLILLRGAAGRRSHTFSPARRHGRRFERSSYPYSGIVISDACLGHEVYSSAPLAAAKNTTLHAYATTMRDGSSTTVETIYWKASASGSATRTSVHQEVVRPDRPGGRLPGRQHACAADHRRLARLHRDRGRDGQHERRRRLSGFVHNP